LALDYVPQTDAAVVVRVENPLVFSSRRARCVHNRKEGVVRRNYTLSVVRKVVRHTTTLTPVRVLVYSCSVY